MKRRNLILLLGGASSGAMSVGTGAFSSVEAERGVEVNVVGDENAYLGLTEVNDGSKAVQITNQFSEALDLTVTVEDRDDVISSIEIDGSEAGGDSKIGVMLGAGSETHVAVWCDEKGEKAEFTLSFDGRVDTGTTVEASRTYTITCDEGNLTDEVVVQFPGGSGKAKINSGIDGKITVTAYYEDNNDDSNEGVTSTDVEGVSKGRAFGLDNDIIGVGISGVGVFKKSDAGPDGKVTEDRAVTGDDPFGSGGQ